MRLPLGARAGLAAACLFGAGAPLATRLVASIHPIMVAGLLYCGAGLGLWLFRLIKGPSPVRLSSSEWPRLLGAVLLGGIAGPVLLMFGLAHLPATASSLLLNAESVLTALVAWSVFREHIDRRIAAGMAAIAAGAVVITLSSGFDAGAILPSLAVIAACLCWAMDNNLTRTLALNDALWLAAIKGSVAGPANVALAFAVGAKMPRGAELAGVLVLGFFAFGLSLVLFIVSMRHVGAARAGAYFSVAPFFGSLLAVALGDPMTWWLATAAVLMGIGVWLHVSERHSHAHAHPIQTHNHWHSHDLHHDHSHEDEVASGARHRHEHEHPEMTHDHEHFPDAHHRHRH